MDKRYVFRGNASGISARITKPVTLLTSAGASSLGVVGGNSVSQVSSATAGGLWDKFICLFTTKSVAYTSPEGELLAFKNVRTQAVGDTPDGGKSFKTTSRSTIAEFAVEMKRLTAKTVDASLQSTYKEGAAEPDIVPLGTQISDLRLDNYPIYVTFDLDPFVKYPTYESLAAAYRDEEFYKRYGHRFQKSDRAQPTGKEGATTQQPRTIPKVSGFVVTSIVSEVKTEHPKAKVDGNVVTLEGFGKIYLGELLISEAYRRLTLIRLKLGSPMTGDIACAEVETNGILME